MLGAAAILQEDGRPDRDQERGAGRAGGEGRMEQGLVYVEYIEPPAGGAPGRVPARPDPGPAVLGLRPRRGPAAAQRRAHLAPGPRAGVPPRLALPPARPAAPGRLGRHLPRRGGRAPRPDGGARLAHRPRRLLPRPPPPLAASGGPYYAELFRPTGSGEAIRALYQERARGHPALRLNLLATRLGVLAPAPGGLAVWSLPDFGALSRIAEELDGVREPVRLVSAATYADTGREIL